DFANFMQGSTYICGHNIINHDLKYIKQAIHNVGVLDTNVIDTLFLSPLLFPTKPYHALLKDDKLQTEELNNPLNDAKKAKDLFFDEITAFHKLEYRLKQIYFALLHDQKEFSPFFHFNQYEANVLNIEEAIRSRFHGQICTQANLESMILNYPIALAYCLALI